MPDFTKRAKVLKDHEVNQLREWIRSNSRMPERDELMFYLSFHAGLRASEIAKLDLDAMTDARDESPSNKIIIDSKVAKNGRPRSVPMTHRIHDALLRFRGRYPEATFVAIGGYDQTKRMTANAVTVHMWTVLKKAGFRNASSHSGRRTYITNLARRINNYGGSLLDVQQMAGHARLNTTQKYVDANPATYAAAASLGG